MKNNTAFILLPLAGIFLIFVRFLNKLIYRKLYAVFLEIFCELCQVAMQARKTTYTAGKL